MNDRTRRLVTLLASIGLAVAVVAAWPRSDAPAPEGVPAAAPEAGPTSGSASAAAAPSGTTAREPVGRRDASLTSPQRSDEPAPPVRPVRVTVAGVDIDAPVRPVGVAADGQMQLPADPRVFGWYRFGPTPGVDDTGSAVIAGHLDSRQLGLGPLVRLRDVEVGDAVAVRTSDGRATSYQVVSVERFDRQGLPAEVFARNGTARLRLVTCGGAYDPGRGGYQENLVVTAAPVAGD